MAKFARIIELEDDQVVLLKKWDPEEERHTVQLHATSKDIDLMVEMGFENEEDRDDCFDNYSTENARTFLDFIRNTEDEE